MHNIFKYIEDGCNTILGLFSDEEKRYKGTHIFADYKGLVGDENEIGKFVFDLMQESIMNASTMKIVHKNLVILNEETQGMYTPAGFTSCLLLDSSHFTSHSYTQEEDMGLMCIDIFTCNSDDTLKIVEYFESKMKEKYSNVECISIEMHKRFRY